MEIFIWICIIILWITGIVGVIVPVIPSVLFVLASFILYHFTIDSEALSLFFWLLISGITLTLLLADLFTNKYFVKKYGGSKASEFVAIIGVIVGMFVIPPIGMIAVPFLLVFLVELFMKQNVHDAWSAALGALAGFLSGIVVKVGLLICMIVFFFIAIIV